MNYNPSLNLSISSPISIAAAMETAVGYLTHESGGRLEAEVLLSYVLDVERSYLYAWPERELTAAQWACFMQTLQRRARGEPLAYIRRRQEFWLFDLQVTPATLIPRPETERLVELALQRIRPNRRLKGADLGTGSGAVALAIASERPQVHVVATDISMAALKVAQENASHLGLDNVVFQLGDWLTPLKGQCLDFIVSNPPYVAAGDPHLFQGSLCFEPHTALVGGGTGLEAIHAIATGAREVLTEGGWLLLEHGYNQGAAALALLKSLGYQAVANFSDLAGVPRVVVGQCPSCSPAHRSE